LFNKLNDSIKELPDKWDSFYLGATVTNHYTDFPLEKYSNNLFRIKSAYALHSVAFSKTGLLKIKNFFSNREKWYIEIVEKYENMDVFIAKDYLKNSNSYITKDLLCFQKTDFSNIENTVYNYDELMINNFNFFKKSIT
jgi:hypothetical protein